MISRAMRVVTCGTIIGLLAGSAWAQAPAGQHQHGQHQGGRPTRDRQHGIEGRWNLTVTTGQAKQPSWLGVQSKDGKLEARFLGTAGSVGGTEDFKFENDTVTFKAHGREWTGKMNGRDIEGTWKKGNEQGTWVAERSWPHVDPSGKWNVKAGDKAAVLTLARQGRTVTGKWTEDGKESEISQAHAFGGHLSFTVNGRQLEAAIKGDVLEGKELTGTRERKWGKPIDLFDGKETDMANWESLGDGNHWKVVDGVMTNGANHTENIVTKRKDFRNFKLHVEFKVPPKGNSGVYLRGRHEVQVADSYGEKVEEHICGAMYSRLVPKLNATKPAGEWQAFDIVLIDNYLTVLLNDQKIIDNQEVEGITGGALDSNEWEPGPIYLQGDHSQIFYRKVILTPAE